MQAVVSHPTFQVIHPQDSLNAVNALAFEHNLTAILRQDGVKALLVNLEAVESLDSAGLMALISVLKLSQSQGQRFSLCSVSPSLRIIFELTQLDRVFDILA